MDFASLSFWLLLGVSCVLLLASIWRRKGGKGPLPPGPTPLPILGNIFQLDRKDMAKSLVKLSEVYGPVFTVHLGLQPVVVLCGYDLVKEALVDHAEEFSGRGQLASFSKHFKEYGIVFANGERWKQLRRFSLSTLRNFGMGKRSVEERMQEEARCLADELHRTNGMPFDPAFMISRAISNVICALVFGNRFEYDDEKFLKLNKLITKRFRLGSLPQAMLYNMFPGFLEKIPGIHHGSTKCSQKIINFIEEQIKARQTALDPSDPQNYIDCFLVKMEQEKGKPDTEFFMENLVMATFNLFFAGTETISTTLRYGLLFLLKYPEVQAKVQEEIDSVIGQDRSPAFEDRHKMPYTEAVLHEIQRFADILPMSLPHTVIQDTCFRGYVIPKGTYIYPLLTTVHSDTKYHTNPEVFDPRRFLDDNGCFKKLEAFMPFAAGKRVCLGEGMARMELFLFMTGILQRFTLTSPVPPSRLSLAPTVNGISRMPEKYELSMVPRRI